MKMLPFIMTRDINGYNGFGLPFSNVKRNTILSANVAQTLTVPVSADATYSNVIAVFSFEPGASIWVANNETAAIPSGSFTTATSELNPAARAVKGGDVLSFITADTTSAIGVTFYAIA
jgi:hypothetical protein